MTGRDGLVIRRAGTQDIETAAAAVATAFMDEPVACWMFPDEDGRRRIGGPIFRAMVTQAHATGEVLIAHDDEGIAGVLLSQPMGADESLSDVEDDFGEYAERLALFAKLTEERHALFTALTAKRYPDRSGHLDLPCLAVLGEHRGTGLGNTLMWHRLARADDEGLAAYGDATSASWARVLMERHGFEPLGEQITLPGPPETRLWPVWRQPR
jgi:GNAT superfamily N-acetyltransferase